jgi:hypothetical protein
MCLPPNTTHALQPLDVTTFGFVLFYFSWILIFIIVVLLKPNDVH